MTRASAAVIHVRVGATEAMPWRGISPLHKAGLTAGLAARAEHLLSKETRFNPSRLATLPSGDKTIHDSYKESSAP